MGALKTPTESATDARSVLKADARGAAQTIDVLSGTSPEEPGEKWGAAPTGKFRSSKRTAGCTSGHSCTPAVSRLMLHFSRLRPPTRCPSPAAKS